jgi:BON domain
MARDFEEGFENLSDEELRDIVRERLVEHKMIDIDDVTVDVTGGFVTLQGRVGTDAERQVADHVLTDLLGLHRFRNDIFIDPNRRAASPAPIDDHLAEQDKEAGLLLGDKPIPLSPEAEHLADRYRDEDGTTDVSRAIRDATSWIPPESPTPEGPAPDGEIGEQH